MQDQYKNQNTVHSSQLTMPIQNIDIEELPPEHQIGDDNWLTKQFNSLPFLLYKFWLLLNFAVALLGEYGLISLFNKIKWNQFDSDTMLYISTHTTFLLLFYACGEMLFAINRRKSRAAQRSFLKFQYYSIGSIVFSIILMRTIIWKARRFGIGILDIFLLIILVIPPIIHLVGGYAVLRAFKKNHPFRRTINSEEVSNPLRTDFLEQNEALVSEVSKYDEKLNRWPYMIFSWWLKLAVAFEILVIFGCIFSLIMTKSVEMMLSLTGFLLVGALILSLFNAYSRFEMENAMQTRNLTRSKKAILLLKISVISSILCYLFVAIELQSQEVEWCIPTFKSFAFFVTIPVLCLIGALKVHKLIEERDTFVKASSFNEDKYL